MVEPKTKSQNPAARAKRLKRLLVNPDFAEAVEFERSLVNKYKQCVSESADVLVEALASIAAPSKSKLKASWSCTKNIQSSSKKTRSLTR